MLVWSRVRARTRYRYSSPLWEGGFLPLPLLRQGRRDEPLPSGTRLALIFRPSPATSPKLSRNLPHGIPVRGATVWRRRLAAVDWRSIVRSRPAVAFIYVFEDFSSLEHFGPGGGPSQRAPHSGDSSTCCATRRHGERGSGRRAGFIFQILSFCEIFKKNRKIL